MKREKAVNGDANYTAKDEKLDRKKIKKQAKSMKTAGIANALKKAKSTKDKPKLVKVKPSSKMGC